MAKLLAGAKRWIAAGGTVAVVATTWRSATDIVRRCRRLGRSAVASEVVVSKPLVREVSSRLSFLGHFFAVEQVELRAEVGGTLINTFQGRRYRQQGNLLFTIDPRPYEIRLAQANAQLETATARLTLAGRELEPCRGPRLESGRTMQTVDQRLADRAPRRQLWMTRRRNP